MNIIILHKLVLYTQVRATSTPCKDSHIKFSELLEEV